MCVYTVGMKTTHRSLLAEHLATEHRISAASVYVKEIVFGGNDGIVTTFAVVAGFAGASSGQAGSWGAAAVLLFGLANLLADGASMGLGNFLSSRSERDVYLSERHKESTEIVRNTRMEKLETIEILEQQGYSAAEAEQLTELLAKSPSFWVDFMMQYELKLDAGDESPLKSALVTFASFVFFGAIPLAPYIFGVPAVWATFCALFLLGVVRWRSSKIGFLRSVSEVLLIGGLAAGIAYGVGRLFA